MKGLLLGPYRLLEELGSGGMGTVWLARVEGAAPGLEVGDRVAIKVIHPHLLARPGLFKRFLREGDVGRRIRHENVVRTIDVDGLEVDGRTVLFLAMEHVEGQTLRSLIEELSRVPEELCRHIGRELAIALAAIHDAGVVHRDLKPENALITADHLVKVMDLGVARLETEEQRLSQDGAFVGSVLYAAPEQFTGTSGSIDGRADLYALGLLLYELATGEHPFGDEGLRGVLNRQLYDVPKPAGERNPQITVFFEEVLRTLLQKDREDRFDSAAELALVLELGEQSDWWRSHAREVRRETKTPLRRVRVPRETALYGRENELDRLRRLYAAAADGEGQVVLVEGEAGIGKTRLVDEFVGELRERGEVIHFLYGGYPPGGAATPSWAFATAYREQFGEEGLTEVLSGYLPTMGALVPAAAALLRGEPPPTGIEPLTRDSFLTVLVQATRGLATERPTVVLIDDLHFAPDEGRAIFAGMALAVPDHRVLLIGATRQGLPESWLSEVERLDHTTRISLDRLGPTDLVPMLEEALASPDLAEELGGEIISKSDGNPFFVFEILKGLREGRIITRAEDGSWIKTGKLGEIRVPSSVLELIQARISELDEEDREILDVASCLGFEFDPLLAAAALGVAQIPAMKRLARIEKTHRLVHSAGRVFVFDHHQVQEALYGGLPELLREPYHSALADALLERERAAGRDAKELSGKVAVKLCDHLLEAGRCADALRYFEKALSHLEMGYQNAAALRLIDRALSLPGLLTGRRRVEVLLLKARRLDTLGRREEQKETLFEALPLADAEADPVLAARTRRYIAVGLLAVARPEDALVTMTDAHSLAREGGNRREEGLAKGYMGLALKDIGRFVEARHHCEDALAILGEVGDRREEAIFTARLGILYQALGSPERCRRLYERSLALSREIGDKKTEAVTLGNLGYALQGTGRLEMALDHHHRQLDLSRRTGYRRGEGSALGNEGATLRRLGRYTAAFERIEQWRAISREIGDLRSVAFSHAELANLLLELGDHEGAVASLEKCVQALGDHGHPMWAGYGDLGFGRVATLQGDLAEAEIRLARAVSAFEEVPFPMGVAEALLPLAGVLDAAGRREEAASHLAEAVRIGRELDSPGLYVPAAVRLCRLDPSGDTAGPARLVSDLEDRLDHLTRLEVRYLLWRITGDGVQLEHARRLLEEGRARAPREYRLMMLENVPVRRAAVAACGGVET